MNATLLIALVLSAVAVLGLAAGSFLGMVVDRVCAGVAVTVPRRCATCNAPATLEQSVPLVSRLRPALRTRCAKCGARISARHPLIELATSAAFVAVVWLGIYSSRLAALGLGSGAAQRPEGFKVFAAVLVVVAYLYLASISIALALIDLDTHRLPNAIVLPSYIVLATLFTAACLFGAPWQNLLRAAIAGVTLFAFYWLLRAIRPGGMGGGDVKLAGVLGAALGWTGWGSVAVGVFAAFFLGGFVGIALMLTRRATRTTAIPFGPFMLIGAWIGIVLGEPPSRGYLGLLSAA